MKRIHVTTLDIEDGEPGSPTACPIARAVKRKLKTNNVSINSSTATIDGTPHDLPAEARDFIRWFDEEGATDVEPFVFELNGGL